MGVCARHSQAVYFLKFFAGWSLQLFWPRKVLPGGGRIFLLPVHPMSSPPSGGPMPETKRGGPGYIQACRALMITAIFLGFLGLFLGMVGLRCVNIGSMELSRKAKLAAAAGALHILAGFCGMVAISWYAFNITQEFFDPVYAGTKYELGPALYLGWSASLLAILGGFCLGSGCCGSPDAAPAPRLPYEASAVRSPGLPGRLRPAASDEGDSTFGKYGKNAYV
ncbi:claudin-15 isoform X1 [Mirounga angustirostris]|uniref:claudin-15 isoform X1 n=1 Tax=Mirounga angustirostris TaxID=9716 RepID=UPI001E68A013|nr:claudin-15 isoform X2 [Mirounga angustirostris]